MTPRPQSDIGINDEIAARFTWHTVRGRCFLELNMLNATKEECIAIAHAMRYFGEQGPSNTNIYLLVNITGANVTLEGIRIAARQAKVKRYFYAIAAYGSKSRLWIVASRLLSSFYPNGARIFDSKNLATEYLLQLK